MSLSGRANARSAELDAPAQLDLLNLSFVQMINEGVPLHEPESQDYIYCTGLFDYIKSRGAPRS